MKALVSRAKLSWRILATLFVASSLFACFPLMGICEEAASAKPGAASSQSKKGEQSEKQSAEAVKHGPKDKAEYWLGISCGPVPEALRAHLPIPEDQGILVYTVAKDSPADKAGIRQHDILLEAGGKVLKTPEDLVAVVNEHKDQKFELKLLRKGKTESVNICGEPRPVQAWERVPPFPGPFASSEAWQKWFDWFHKQLPHQPPLTFRFYRPGIVLPPGETGDLPKDLTIIVTKQGSEPAKIVVRRGDKTWEVTEKELDKLPKEIRPHVERMIRGNRGRADGVLKVLPFSQPLQPKGLEKDVLKPFRPWSAAEAERLDKLEKQIEELKKRFEELEKGMSDSK